MDTYKTPLAQPPERTNMDANPIIVQQYARYPHNYSALPNGSPGSGQSRIAASASPPLRRKDTRSIQSSPRGPLSSVMPSTGLRTGPSMSPPIFDTNARMRSAQDPGSDAERRFLPSQEITDENIDDAYASFILYCNPNVPATSDTTELKKIFRSPPRSDGKNFSIYVLWELIQKLDKKELKTWIQLAIELGVEPPSTEKKQSTQKVQQYAVRLKRWMRAMHVDAFFEYCLGHSHIYYTQLPSSTGPASDSRDGVPLEEDLALRALVPEWKPKRGRKRADEKEVEEARAKRLHLDTSEGILDHSALDAHSANFPQSAIPFSAFPDDLEATDPWGAASSFASNGAAGDSFSGQELRWYPQSAVIPRTSNPNEGVGSAEPRSAVTPSTRDRSRNRRRHGPAVSSAWPSTGASSTGKRGRPPNRGFSTEGPFSSFPANPRRSITPLGDNQSLRSTPAITAEKEMATNHLNQISTQQPSDTMPPLTSRPNKLQLQVPDNPGRPVRLATPPAVLINGTDGAASAYRPLSNDHRGSVVRSHNQDQLETGSVGSAPLDRNLSRAGLNISVEDFIRSMANQIYNAKFNGRSTPLDGDEARALARAAFRRLQSVYSNVPSELLSNFCAHLFGMGSKFGVGDPSASTFTVNVDAAPGNHSFPGSASTFTLLIESRHASGFSTNSILTGLSLFSRPESVFKEPSLSRENIDMLDSFTEDGFEDEFVNNSSSDLVWKQRYLRLRQQLRRKEIALREYKRNILNSVMADI